ncbi:MAG: hypothetical protein K1X35_00295 [Caulobacteraceae bacterium]|nr:hypothetical protein [Caulobacteraceae bacterium]
MQKLKAGRGFEPARATYLEIRKAPMMYRFLRPLFAALTLIAAAFEATPENA